ncbi:hypothetical protein RFI_14890 [Reticulomyxa filosa]|uniref:Uncharacterized protein n=1 Tax=Reticulomyxa filosa TaxID=46433 RepID=X6N7P5_RETFI|nr:hypothetical protein RFI_14890 [Reticulomyxa filosa]|eukprot:ETO22310.1 hypothetical protein RFI_14890 [Reticulomyxa filosa]
MSTKTEKKDLFFKRKIFRGIENPGGLNYLTCIVQLLYLIPEKEKEQEEKKGLKAICSILEKLNTKVEEDFEESEDKEKNIDVTTSELRSILLFFKDKLKGVGDFGEGWSWIMEMMCEEVQDRIRKEEMQESAKQQLENQITQEKTKKARKRGKKCGISGKQYLNINALLCSLKRCL